MKLRSMFSRDKIAKDQKEFVILFQGNHVNVFEHEGFLEIQSWEQMIIEPRASNCIYLRFPK